MSTNTLCFSLLFLSPQSPVRPLFFLCNLDTVRICHPVDQSHSARFDRARSPERARARAATLDTRPVYLASPNNHQQNPHLTVPSCSRDKRVPWSLSGRRVTYHTGVVSVVLCCVQKFVTQFRISRDRHRALIKCTRPRHGIRDATRVFAACAENTRNSLSTQR